jgi:tetratricopeptide (TPR) repeat protein
VSHKYNKDTYTASKLSDSEEAEWKQERFQTAIKYYRAVLEKLPESGADIKRTIRTELAQVLFDADNIDEAVQMYEDAFNVSSIAFLYFSNLFLFFCFKRMMEMLNGFTKQLIVHGNKEKKNKPMLDFNS